MTQTATCCFKQAMPRSATISQRQIRGREREREREHEEPKRVSPEQSTAVEASTSTEPFDFNSDMGLVGCASFINKCSPEKSDRHLWVSGTFKEWEFGFDECCEQAGHGADTCHGISSELFDFLSPSSPSRKQMGMTVVARAPHSMLCKFCEELGELVSLHFSHLAVAKTLVKEQVAMLSLKFKEVLTMTEEGSGNASAFRVAAKVQACRADADCRAQVSQVVFDRLQGQQDPRNWQYCPEGSLECFRAENSHNCRILSSCNAGGCKWCKQWDEYEQRCVPKSMMCSFAGVSKVWAADGFPVNISSLKPGDLLISPGTSAQHTTHMIDAHAFDAGHDTDYIEFLSISHTMMEPGRPLLITANHLLFSSRDGDSWMLSRALDLHVGNYVQVLKHEAPGEGDAEITFIPSKVIHVGQQFLRGYYSPLTTTGRLVVDGVAVSSYALTGASQNHIFETSSWARGNVEFLWHTALAPTRLWYSTGLPMQWLHDRNFAPVARSAFAAVDTICSGFAKLTHTLR
mmetsp:Transcript_118495/g.209444  ORF Transcript_118495/g.209444 Transcript_118495/m.209444 type:complete len:517 (-) Transcript_118495:238-1788(-)